MLGYAPMDAIHREFVLELEALQTACDDDLPRCLNSVNSHLREHFKTENEWMLENDFPSSECHIDEHAKVLQSIEEVQTLLSQGNVAVCRRLADELANWFPGHANYLDSALSHWMCKKQFGGKPVVLRRR